MILLIFIFSLAQAAESIDFILKKKGTTKGLVLKKNSQNPSGKEYTVYFPENVKEETWTYLLKVENNQFKDLDEYQSFKIDKVEGKKIFLIDNRKKNIKNVSTQKSDLNLGAIVEIYNNYEDSTCLGTHIGKGLVLTNSHCSKGNSICKDSIFRFSTKVKGEKISENIKCRKIVSRNSQFDYMLIQLVKAPKKVFGKISIDKNRYKYSKEDIFYSITIKDDKKEIRKCSNSKNKTSDHLITIKTKEHGLRTTNMLTKCDTFAKKGDSGGPILSAQGGLIGVFWGFLTDRKKLQITNFSPSYVLNFLDK